MSDLISRQAAIDALDKDPMGGLNYNRILNNFPSAQKAGEQQPSYVAEIEEEYKKAVNAKWIRKPLSKALYEVWKRHDREDAERRTDE